VVVIDSSAVIAIVLGEPEQAALLARLLVEPASERVMSTTNYVETGSVLSGRRKSNPRQAVADLDALLLQTGITLAPLDERMARLALEARIRFGKGFGAKAALNLSDCFAYALAKALGAPLLFKGDDFTHTDVQAAL
jgi:ribonuclease VapC